MTSILNILGHNLPDIMTTWHNCLFVCFFLIGFKEHILVIHTTVLNSVPNTRLFKTEFQRPRILPYSIVFRAIRKRCSIMLVTMLERGNRTSLEDAHFSSVLLSRLERAPLDVLFPWAHAWTRRGSRVVTRGPRDQLYVLTHAGTYVVSFPFFSGASDWNRRESEKGVYFLLCACVSRSDVSSHAQRISPTRKPRSSSPGHAHHVIYSSLNAFIVEEKGWPAFESERAR